MVTQKQGFVTVTLLKKPKYIQKFDFSSGGPSEFVRTTFGEALRRALRDARMTQASLARELRIDVSQVNRWTNNKALPHISYIGRIERVLGVDLSDSFVNSKSNYELYISAPLAELDSNDLPQHQDVVASLVAAIEQNINGLYWPGSEIRTASDLPAAADIVTERNLAALANCSAFLYLQFSEIVRPSSALVELGLALGRRMKTTLIVKSEIDYPYMFEGFGAVAASLNFLPNARIYQVRSIEDAEAILRNNGRELLGLS
jgi:transcriptional regulator with XRE-family HTH domain